MESRHYLGLLTAEECDRCLDLFQSCPCEIATTEYGTSIHRRGNVRWLDRVPQSDWLFERMAAVGTSYAREFRVDVESLNSPLQFAEYHVGDKFNWHIDTGRAETIRRKVTISIQLSGGRTYDGGTLEIVGELAPVWRRSRGSATAFASILGHRVTEVTQGSRVALVGWMYGPPFR